MIEVPYSPLFPALEVTTILTCVPAIPLCLIILPHVVAVALPLAPPDHCAGGVREELLVRMGLGVGLEPG